MFDAFKTLELPQTAFLDSQTLQAQYLALSKLHHPDHGGDPQLASEINEAYEILKSTDRRLKHLIALQEDPELSQWRTVTMSEELMALFGAVGQITQQTQALLQKHTAANGALARAILAPQLLALQQKLETLNASIESSLRGLEDTLEAWDQQVTQGQADWKALSKTQAESAYLIRWQGQVKASLLEVMTALL